MNNWTILRKEYKLLKKKKPKTNDNYRTKNTMTKIKYSLDDLNSRKDMEEDIFNELSR